MIVIKQIYLYFIDFAKNDVLGADLMKALDFYKKTRCAPPHNSRQDICHPSLLRF